MKIITLVSTSISIFALSSSAHAAVLTGLSGTLSGTSITYSIVGSGVSFQGSGDYQVREDEIVLIH